MIWLPLALVNSSRLGSPLASEDTRIRELARFPLSRGCADTSRAQPLPAGKGVWIIFLICRPSTLESNLTCAIRHLLSSPPASIALAHSWVFVPPLGCQYVFSLKSASQTIPQTYVLSVGEQSTGRVGLLVQDGRIGASANSPLVFAAPLDEALVVNFTSVGQGVRSGEAAHRSAAVRDMHRCRPHPLGHTNPAFGRSPFASPAAALASFDYTDGFQGSFWARCDPDRDVLVDIILARVV